MRRILFAWLALLVAGGCDAEVREDRYFPDDAEWYRDISGAAVDPHSDQIIAHVAEKGGWGAGFFGVGFEMEVLEVTAGTQWIELVPTEDFYVPDCDQVAFPVPPGGALEGEINYQCRGRGDCHLLVADREQMKLYEMWRANLTGGVLFGGCAVVWDMTRVYPANGRGDQCSSADAAGLPIAPLTFGPDEVAAGEIDHALRFVLPRDRISGSVYVHPGSHGGGTGGAQAAPYGSRWRLRADFPVEQLPSEGARVVARALQRHGMFLADAGLVTLTARSDRASTVRWDGLLDAGDLAMLEVTDFEIVETGKRVQITYHCERNGM